MKDGTQQIGTCAVDSGQILLIDPCYIDSHWDHDSSYDEVCEVSLGEERAGHVRKLFATVTSTGMGDGEYPVYATYKDGMVISVTIEFVPEEDDEDDEDENVCPVCYLETNQFIWNDYWSEHVCRDCDREGKDKEREEEEKENND